MSLVLHVDAPAWRRHLDATVTAYAGGVVPVVKGNGYGLGAATLRPEAGRLASLHGLPTIAIGTYAEAAEHGDPTDLPVDVLVLEPFRAALAAAYPPLHLGSFVHTVASAADLPDLVARVGTPRVYLEGLTSLNRHGMPADEVRAVAAAAGGAEVEGLTLHLPLGDGNVAEIQWWLDQTPGLSRVLLSHVTPAQLGDLRRANPGRDLAVRIGSSLWLGAPAALEVRGDVLDVRPCAAGDRAGYRRRRLPAGRLVVVSGGTAHGVGLEAPSAAAGLRQRGIVLAEAALEALGRVRSPFTHAGERLWFVEPPHMHVSLLVLPAGVTAPRIGDSLPVRVRTTTLHADATVLGGPTGR